MCVCLHLIFPFWGSVGACLCAFVLCAQYIPDGKDLRAARLVEYFKPARLPWSEIIHWKSFKGSEFVWVLGWMGVRWVNDPPWFGLSAELSSQTPSYPLSSVSIRERTEGEWLGKRRGTQKMSMHKSKHKRANYRRGKSIKSKWSCRTKCLSNVIRNPRRTGSICWASAYLWCLKIKR